MAHFAKIDENGLVEQVIVLDDSDCGGGEFPESESIGQQYLSERGMEGTWKQTSYNANFRNKYAGIGWTYSEEHDVFLEPKTFDSWVLNTTTFDWEAPIPMPDDANGEDINYLWDEENGQWVLSTSIE